MIKVIFKHNDNNIIGFKIEGHAVSQEVMDATIGDAYDMICNTVSVLSQNVLIGIQEVLKLRPLYEIENGFLEVNLNNLSEDDIEKCQVLMKTFDFTLKSTVMALNKSLGNKTRSQYIRILKEEV
ncbi:MAG: ribosomal-processing cysteine protease Prp [Inconstantimicrobium porci]|uniref:Ribosomal processing cysteine protease Prp n=1 Tax=Inconstantimicrobium porci TaxID=2652291 RepID=A0A7X2MY96_9CLOT|nr:ribosomal-processing cysteine protease Prp [Inconstantimicrobium porci]MDD6770474.1 ribosomal-processing cysteine protease Prp [Inconstantimicrobium porci]MDY5911003.1 ribosomal-processing cysteine protease Prp [Inconstantimicrobium porci]MSR90845.1 ribosomal-processing cysteine protease Prp [Inconstantimicrobium porci]